MGSILCHTNVSEVVSKYPPKPVSNLQLTPGKFSISLTWDDPEDYTEEGYTCTWEKTVVVRKTGGYPNDIHDGTVVVTTVERNKYKTEPYTDSNLTAGITYYYRVFSCSSDGVYGESAEGSAVPIQYKVMSVVMNMANSSPYCGKYSDDATSMTAGKNVKEWQDFFGYKPCIFKDGKVIGYLNPNDYSKYENGDSVDITYGNAGDVMIEFPRRGLKITNNDNIVTISMTDNPDDPDFYYHAHERGTEKKDHFYIGAYPGWVYNNKLHSLSGWQATQDLAMSTCKQYAKSKGTNYGILGWYQLIYLQSMYLLQYEGDRNVRYTHGISYSRRGSDSLPYTGSANTLGMMYGSTSSSCATKLFGIEDLYGYKDTHVDNLYINSYGWITTTTDDNISNVDNYTVIAYSGTGTWAQGRMTTCIGTTDCGFLPPGGSLNGSTSTYFCAYAIVGSSYSIATGGSYNSDEASIFVITSDLPTQQVNGKIARLQYL